MIWLVVGVLLWSGAHLMKSAGLPLRARLVAALGQAYPAVFALVILGSIGLMVLGFRSAVPTAVYATPTWGSAAANGLVFAALWLFAASALPSNLKRPIRHPQLTGMALWAVGHLFSNGDLRALVLFGGLGVWAVASIAFINRRDGARERPASLPLSVEWKPLVAAIAAFTALYLLHPYIAGVAPTAHF